MREQQLEGFQAELFESFRALGLSESDARAAAVDTEAGQRCVDVRVGLAFGRISHGDVAREMDAIAEAAAKRRRATRSADKAVATPKPVTTVGQSAVDVDRVVAEAFGRRP